MVGATSTDSAYDPALWWIICDYNDIFFPLDLELGMVLRIPSAESVELRIGQ